jgi:protein FAM50
MNSNTSIANAPKALTKSALLREAQTRESLRKEFLAMQDAVKVTEINVPFVFYDGTNIPGGVCRVKKGDYVWVFLDRSRKVGAELGVGEKANSRREWARVGVDDLMMVRGSIILPHVSCSLSEILRIVLIVSSTMISTTSS